MSSRGRWFFWVTVAALLWPAAAYSQTTVPYTLNFTRCKLKPASVQHIRYTLDNDKYAQKDPYVRQKSIEKVVDNAGKSCAEQMTKTSCLADELKGAKGISGRFPGACHWR